MPQYVNDIAYADVLTTALNTLADGSTSSASSTQSPDRGFASFSLALGSINPTSAAARFEVHLCPRMGDGSTISDVTASTLVGVIVVTTGSSAKNGVLENIPLPNDSFQWRVVNRAGVTTAGTGNTARASYYDMAGG